jgi:hypothetical protein
MLQKTTNNFRNNMLNNSGFRVRWQQLTMASLGIFSISFSQTVLSAPLDSQRSIINSSEAIKRADFTRVTSKDVQLQLKSAANKLNSLEAVINNVESKKVVSSAEAEQVSKDTFEYAQSMKQALDIALQEANTLAENKGAKGSIGSLETFEKTEKANLPRLEQLEQKAKSVESKIRSGDIRLSKASLQQLSTTDKQSFVNEISVPARQIYIKQQPELFRGIDIKQTTKTPENSLKSINKLSTGSTKLSDNLHLPIGIVDEANSPKLYSAAAAPCIGLALQRNWAGLAACVVSAGSQATSIYNEFVSCWNGASGWSKWFKRAYCLARLIGRIA